MTRTTALILCAGLAGCGGGSVPTAPSPTDGFLTGVWRGTITTIRDGAPPDTGSTTWTFDPMPGTAGSTYRVTMTFPAAWLPASASMTATVTGPVPPAGISTQGSYASPRGCTGQFGSVGTADRARIVADVHGVDCGEGRVFGGRVELAR